MKVIYQLTQKYLNYHKKRTIFTLLTIILSVTMMNAVGIALSSGIEFYKNTIIQREGSFHYQITTNSPKVIDYIRRDNKVKDYYFTNTVSYNYQQKNIALKRGDSLFYQKRNVSQYLIKGKLPTNKQEIAVCPSYIDKNIGDTITLKNESQNLTFKVVGLINEGSDDQMNFQAISYVDLQDQQFYSIWVEDKDIAHVKERYDRIETNIHQLDSNSMIILHNSYLSASLPGTNFRTSLGVVYILVRFIMVIIVIASVFIIYQAFHLSTHEMIEYLGMLTSIGMTPRQKRKLIFLQGILLTIIALPLGMLCSYLGMWVTFSLINQLDVIQITQCSIHTIFSLHYTLITILLSFITVFISLILPAYRLSKMPVIVALKKNDDVKVKAKRLKINRFSTKFLHIQQQLALKNYKRQGRRSKVIVFSLTISFVLFISTVSFIDSVEKSVLNEQPYDVKVSGDDIFKIKELIHNNKEIESYYYYDDNYRFEAMINTEYMISDISQFYNNEYASLNVAIVDENTYQKICQDNHIKERKHQALVLNTKQFSYQKMDRYFIKDLTYRNAQGKLMKVTPFQNIELISVDDYKIFHNNHFRIEMIISEKSIENGIDFLPSFYLTSKQHENVAKFLEQQGYIAFDETADQNQRSQMMLIAQIFCYGFVTLLIIFSLLNIINMMNASIDHRKNEFGMFLSVGMSIYDLYKMIFYESLVYGMKALLYGMPLSLLIEFYIYMISDMVNDMVTYFQPTYIAYLISFVVMMLIMMITFGFSLKKMKDQNIIETLKNDM